MHSGIIKYLSGCFGEGWGKGGEGGERECRRKEGKEFSSKSRWDNTHITTKNNSLELAGRIGGVTWDSNPEDWMIWEL